jgi:hypothetical protein
MGSEAKATQTKNKEQRVRKSLLLMCVVKDVIAVKMKITSSC